MPLQMKKPTNDVGFFCAQMKGIFDFCGKVSCNYIQRMKGSAKMSILSNNSNESVSPLQREKLQEGNFRVLHEYLLSDAFYNFKIYSIFSCKGRDYVCVSEFTPSGEESDPYLMHSVDGVVYNDTLDVLARMSEGILIITEE